MEELTRWSELLVSLARLRLNKKKAVASEDFAKASQLKKQEKELLAQVAEARRSASAAGGGDAVSEERKQLEEAKRKAVAEEDFAEAGRLKKRLKMLEEHGAGEEAFGRQALGAAAELAAAAEDAEEVAKELAVTAADGASTAAKPTGAAKAKPSPVVKPEAGATSQVKDETAQPSLVPGLSVGQLLVIGNQDLWQKAWADTWQKAEDVGSADDEKAVYTQAQKVWRGWMSERDKLAKERADAEGRRKAEQTQRRGALEEAKAAAARAATVKPEMRNEPAVSSAAPASGDDGLPEDLRAAQEESWRQSRSSEADWKRALAEAERRKKAKEGGGEVKSARDLCALVKLRCPADQPLPFERLLAVCPAKTTVQQLIQAMAKEPQEFRQNFEGTEFCVRPVNSRCADWLPVQATTTPPGFRNEAALPESMLTVAKQIFEERLKPQGHTAEDPLAQYLAQPGRVPPDTPLPFQDLLSKCPPGTKPMDLVRTMAKRRDIFRQDAEGSMFCVRPRARCKDWGAVNPYKDPMQFVAAPVGISEPRRPATSSVVAGGPMLPASQAGGDY